MKVLFVAGMGRSGSTVLGNLLGQHRDISFVGEMNELWQRGVEEDRLCACGARFSACELWTAVRAHPLAQPALDRASDLAADMRSLEGAPTALALLGAYRSRTRRRLASGMSALAGLYRSVGVCSDSAVLVDTSHNPLYGYLLARQSDVPVVVLHLVRDPRGVAYSRSRVVRNPDPADVVHAPRRGVLRTSLTWEAVNRAVEGYLRAAAWRYLRVRYEDLVSEPRGALTRILETVECRDDALPWCGDGCMEVGPTHAVWGNRSRFRRGPVTLRLDERWRREMAAPERSGVTLLALAGLLRYGYLGGA